MLQDILLKAVSKEGAAKKGMQFGFVCKPGALCVSVNGKDAGTVKRCVCVCVRLCVSAGGRWFVCLVCVCVCVVVGRRCVLLHYAAWVLIFYIRHVVFFYSWGGGVGGGYCMSILCIASTIIFVVALSCVGFGIGRVGMLCLL